jgi:transposase InsO family protein
VVLAAKRAPNGTWSDKRFCVNFIPINKHTELDRYGSHRAEDLFHKVTKAKYLTALDLRSGFHQIPVSEEDVTKTAFWWVSARSQPPRLLAYQRMPFGLKNAPAKFQRVMDTELAFSGCSEFAFAYIDDLLIASDTWEEHVVHVDRVLQMLVDCNLRIHPDKSIFGTNIVEYLGHNVIGEHGIAMSEAKVEAIKVLPNPTNIPELRSILGFLSYYRHFIPGFSSLAAPMTKLLSKDVPWRWESEQQHAYDHLKSLMTEYGRVLRKIDPDRPLLLHTDWSNHGIGAVLGQVDDEGQEYLCGCISRSLNKHEKNYPSYKGELLALAWAVRSFRTHLHGTKFDLVTDHQPLTWLMKARDLTGQYSRWQMLLQEYDFEIHHRAGAKHQNADVLSRFPCKSTSDYTGARMDVERIAAVVKASGGYHWVCPDHGTVCPGRPHLPSEYEWAPCPEHGSSCTSKSCAALLRAQYTWDFAAKRWVDPQESRDTCMECCTEALYAHPRRDDVCMQVCHESSGLPLPRPPTPPKRRDQSTDVSAKGHSGYRGPRTPNFQGRFVNYHGRDHYHWESQKGSGNYANPRQCYLDCRDSGLAQAQHQADPVEAERLVRRSCLKSCQPYEKYTVPHYTVKKQVAFASPIQPAARCCRTCGVALPAREELLGEPPAPEDTTVPGANREFVDLMLRAPEPYPSYDGYVSGMKKDQWVWKASGDASDLYKIDEECIADCYRQGMHALAPKLGALQASESVYSSCRYGCRKGQFEPIPEKKKISIDAFAPQFTDFISSSNSGFLGRDCYMNNGLREAFEPETEDAGLGEHQRSEHHQVTVTRVATVFQKSKARITAALPDAIAKVAAELSTPTNPESAKLHRGVVSNSFFSNAQNRGITLIELCAGIGAGLEAALLSGIKVNRYLYVDIDPLARDIAKFRVANLSAKFPDLFPPSAWEHAFTLPQDINAIRDYQLDHLLAGTPQQILLMAGWPCQEYSPAGKGKPGPRAAILDRVIHIIARLQALQPEHPVAYLLENVAIHENFRHKHIRTEVADEVVSKIGTPVTFDAADVGSYATRVRSYWTNLASSLSMKMVYDHLKTPHKGTLYDILGPGRHPMPVDRPSRGGHNQPGQIRAILPTLMSFRTSRAFKPTCAGSIYASQQCEFLEPTAVESELAMGYEAGTTAAPEVSDSERCMALGQAIDLNALFSIFQVARHLQRNGLAYAGAVKREPLSKAARTVVAFRLADPGGTLLGDRTIDSCVPKNSLFAYIGTTPTDVWDDVDVIRYLKDDEVPSNPEDFKRVARRARAYRWFNNRLHKVIREPGEPITYRTIPPSSERDQLILKTHTELGHIGEKRCIAAMSGPYWWYGMTLDIKRVVAGCKECQRVKASGGLHQRDMQTTSPDEYGMFHRWGLDHIVDLPASASGHKHALVCIDYYSKWVEVIPVRDLSAETTVQVFLLNVIARFGTPAEIITDNGGAFKGEFRDFCKRRLIHQRFITEDVPRSNGLAERAVQTIKSALRKFAAQKHHALDWDTFGLAAILAGYRLTPQAASKHSPARILFALDPVIDAEQHISRMGKLDFQHPSQETVDAELWKRVKYIQDLGASVSHNLRTAHERDCRRFKARRSGLYIPKIHHFLPGDYVFILSQGQKPGGTLGIRARNEVMRVEEVRDTGVLILINQAGQRFEKHMEHCAPCMLPNLLGETYAGLSKPQEDLPCQVCRDHRHGDLMLLCDNCDSGWHTFCLQPPLDSVPDGDWLCPDCEAHGMTLEKLQAKRDSRKEDKRSRPALELPGPSRIAKARRLAEAWHGMVVKHKHHGKPRFGRVHFQGILEPKWFRIDWADGSSTEHMAHIFANLEKIDDADAPDRVPPRPDPVVIAAARRHQADKLPKTTFPWARASIENMGITDLDRKAFKSLFHQDLLSKAFVPALTCGKTNAKILEATKRQILARDLLPLNDLREFQDCRPGLHKLLSDEKPEVILVPSSLHLFFNLMPMATWYAKSVVCAKLPPREERMLWRGDFHMLAWYLGPHHKGQILLQRVNHPDPAQSVTWLYVFNGLSRSSHLTIDLPNSCSYISCDTNGNIESTW